MTQQLDVETRPASASAARPRRWAQAGATAACTGAVLLTHKSIAPAVPVTLVLLATLGAVDLARREHHRPGDPRPIVCAIVALDALAIARPTRFATDIWSYTMVGRTLAVHHLNPYRVAPAVLAHDPLLRFLPHTWRGGTTPYGPLFVLQSAGVSLVAGTHPLVYRVAFQLAAAAAVGIALWLLWRRTGSTAALAIVGLHPMVAGSIVNAGHNDATLALALLGAILLLTDGRARAAGFVLLAALLVKVTIAVAIVPVAVWTARRWGARAFADLAVPVVAGGALSLLVPGALHSMTNANTGVVTRLSIWNIPQRVSWLGLTHTPATWYGALGLVAVGALVALAAWAGRTRSDAGPGAAAAAAGFLVGSAYVLAWYSLLGFLAAALRPADRVTRWIAVQAGVITAAYLIPRADLASARVVGDVVLFWVPLALAATFAWAMSPLVRGARVSARTSPTATA